MINNFYAKIAIKFPQENNTANGAGLVAISLKKKNENNDKHHPFFNYFNKYKIFLFLPIPQQIPNPIILYL